MSKSMVRYLFTGTNLNILHSVHVDILVLLTKGNIFEEL